MSFVSWLVYGVFFMLAESVSGAGYLLAIGLAFTYPAIGAYLDASLGMQLAALGGGAVAHALIARALRKPGSAPSIEIELGASVDVIEWLDECTARVFYRGQEWQADKADSRMPDADRATIKSVQGSRLIIVT